MNKLAISQMIACLGILAAPLGWAQPVEPATNSPAINSPATNSPATDAALERVELEEPKPILLNRIGVGYRMGLNITVDFKKLGGFPAISDPGPALGIADRTYDNGSYNRVDISTNAGGLTWFWGYENPGQLQGNALVMESVLITQ